MKLSNEKRKFYFQVINTLLVISVLIFVFGLIITVGKSRWNIMYLAISTVLLYSLHKFRGYPFFAYDSDGETLNFTNKDFFLLFGDPKMVKHAEFPKRKLLDYKIYDNIYRKKLKLVVSSSRSPKTHTTQSFNITYLNRDEVRDLKRSLEKVLKHNKHEN